METAQEIIYCVRESTQVVAAARLRKRKFDKRGLVKISLLTLEEKLQVLRNKRKLVTNEKFKRVFLKSSKSHTNRIIELNACTLLVGGWTKNLRVFLLKSVNADIICVVETGKNDKLDLKEHGY